MMDRDQALALLKTCRHIGLVAWYGHVHTAYGERHVVCCRPAPGHPALWLLSPADLEVVQGLGDFETRKPVHATASDSPRGDSADVRTFPDGDGETGPAAICGAGARAQNGCHRHPFLATTAAWA